ncbi:MAG: hypothetical protein L3J93_02650 [Thermoplasmata archaeon]|nr:hypothetical protein [Thermoplasmata archaeon]
MRASEAAPSQWVQLMQAMVGRELVERLGLPGRTAARRLGVAPSSISQYLTGKRTAGPLDWLTADPEAQREARAVAVALAEQPPDAPPAVRTVLAAASALSERFSGALPGEHPLSSEPPLRRELAGYLRRRIAAEQSSVADCMHLAQKARDELTRALFRHIASDSLRHAEIVASLATYLDRGIDATHASGITPDDVQRLIARETEAEQGSARYLDRSLGGVMGLLADSIEADERKHEQLLRGLLSTGFSPGEGRHSASSRSSPRSGRVRGAARRKPRGEVGR